MDLKFSLEGKRAMLDRGSMGRPECKSAIVAGKLTKYTIYIAASSEVRFFDAGSRIFLCGKPDGEIPDYGLALTVKNSLIPRLTETSKTSQ